MKCYIELIPAHEHIKLREGGIEADASPDREWFKVERNGNVYWFPKHRVACVRMADGKDFMGRPEQCHKKWSGSNGAQHSCMLDKGHGDMCEPNWSVEEFPNGMQPADVLEGAALGASKSVAKAIADSPPITREALLEAALDSMAEPIETHGPKLKPPVPSRKKKRGRK